MSNGDGGPSISTVPRRLELCSRAASAASLATVRATVTPQNGRKARWWKADFHFAPPGGERDWTYKRILIEQQFGVTFRWTYCSKAGRSEDEYRRTSIVTNDT